METFKIYERQVVSDDVLMKHFNKDLLDFYQQYYFTDTFLEKYKKRIRWEIMCLWGVLSEEQMEKFADWVNWDYACRVQKISFPFILKHAHRLSVRDIETMLEHNVYIDKNEWIKQGMDVAIKLVVSRS